MYELFEIVSRELKVTRNVGEIMKRVLEEESMKMKGKEISKIVLSLVKDPSKIPLCITSRKNELETIGEASEFLRKEFDCYIDVPLASDHPKAKSAVPGKVGILVE